MGTDILSWVEVLHDQDRWIAARRVFPASRSEREYDPREFYSEPFRNRNYSLFGFLADVRNLSYCEPLDLPRGLPRGYDVESVHSICAELSRLYEPLTGESLEQEFHDHSWFLLSELLAFDYDKFFHNQRTSQADPATLAPFEAGWLSYRTFLESASYFQVLEVMKTLGPPDRVRLVFCFDS